jgi:RimJ/RimL family protein N-acetyltransferase
VLEQEGDWLTYAVVWRENGKVIGEVGLKWLSREHRQGEIGFIFIKGEWGEELVYAILDHEWRARRSDSGLDQ